MADAARSVRTFEGLDLRVRPVEPSDREGMRAMFDRMSPESRYQRFLSPTPKLSESQLTYLTDVDHHSHEALVAETALAGNEEVIDMLRRLGRTEVHPAGTGAVEMRIALADGTERGAPLREALKRHASGELEPRRD